MRIAVVASLLAATFPLGVRAQEQLTTQAPSIQKATPGTRAEALAALDALIARYGELRSYSDRCEGELKNGTMWPERERDRMTFTATLAFERPGKLRFEGRTPKGAFLLVNDGTTTRVINPENKELWLERPQGSPLNLRSDYSHPSVKLPLGEPVPLDGGWADVGPTLVAEELIFRPQAWMDERDLIVGAAFGEDETIDGEQCGQVVLFTDYGAGSLIQSRLWIAKSDGLLRRFERIFGQDQDKNPIVMIETHSQVRPDVELPSETWSFAAPEGVKLVDRFPAPYPVADGLKLKVGDSLPVFSQDGINGEAVELNPKSREVTVVYFFFANLAGADGASLQRLQRVLGAQKLHLVATAGDTKRERVQALIAKNKLEFPIYFDEKGYRNQLAAMMGVRGWPLVLLFDRDAKLRAIAERPGDEEFVQALRQEFPDVAEQTIMDALMGTPEPLATH